MAGARPHPVQVAPQRVDLPVVGEIPERLRQRPGRKGIGAVTLVNHGHGGLEIGIGQVPVETGHLRCQHQALIHDRTTGKRQDIEILGIVRHLRLNRLFKAPAQDIQAALQHRSGGVLHGYKKLDDDRQTFPGRATQHVRRRRHLAPTEKVKPFGRHHALDDRATG